MDVHVKQVGILMIAFGIAGLIVGAGALLFFGGVTGLMVATDWTGFGVVITGLILYNLLLSIPLIVTGYGVLQYQIWARLLMVVLSALNILNVPIGSILAAYALWVLMTPETEPLFLSPPPGFRGTPKKQTRQPVDSGKATRVVPSKADLQP